MAGYFGTETQQRLQAHAEANAEFIAKTPGACQAGRTMGCDDPKIFGWDRIEEIVARDGVCGFRLIDTSDVEILSLNCRLVAAGLTLGMCLSPVVTMHCLRADLLPISLCGAATVSGRRQKNRRASS